MEKDTLPVTYFWEERLPQESGKNKFKNGIYSNHIIDRLLSLKGAGVYPEFVKMDKDVGQIWAARNVWSNACVSLCLWHMLRAIKKRCETIKSPRKLDLEK
jgi:hypothetical protein